MIKIKCLEIKGASDGSGIGINTDHLPVIVIDHELPFRNAVRPRHIEWTGRILTHIHCHSEHWIVEGLERYAPRIVGEIRGESEGDVVDVERLASEWVGQSLTQIGAVVLASNSTRSQWIMEHISDLSLVQIGRVQLLP